MEEQGKAVKDLEKEVAVLKVSLAESNARLEDLNNKFSILHEKVQSQKAVSPAPVASSPLPPSDLEVVRLPDTDEFLKLDDALGAPPEEKKTAKPKASKSKRPFKAEGEKRPASMSDVPAAKTGTVEGLYNLGQDHFIAGRFSEARAAFAELVAAYPKDDLADNALYWTAETYYTVKDYKKAAGLFNSAAEKYPAGNKAPDSLLKAGFSLMELDDLKGAKAALDALIKRYSGTDAAVKAKKTLERLSGEKVGNTPNKEGMR
ncbi:MAG: tol-pal system protein YbgF [Deltaproteobacteria bacterium]|nr:tol-pal system protein YbgF [Deltaproteobacteria bacterium]